MASTAWVVVPNLDEAKAQLDKEFPKRDTASDGGIGNQAHAQSTSSHNPDKTGSAEFKDGDSKNEVRARDFDKDLKDPDVTMEQVVQLWVTLARAGQLWWVRYIIYNGRIWHRRDGFKTREYVGKNKHTEHVHVNSDFTQKADEVKNTNWHLTDLRKKPTKPATPAKPKPIVVDGKLSPTTVKRWQSVTKQTQNGKLTPAFVKWLQVFLKDRVDHRIKVDGDFGEKTIAGLQRYLKSPVDGFISKPRSELVVALQRRLNKDKF